MMFKLFKNKYNFKIALLNLKAEIIFDKSIFNFLSSIISKGRSLF